MKKNFIDPEMEIILFSEEDIITDSLTGDDGSSDEQNLPKI